jgi:DNA primase
VSLSPAFLDELRARTLLSALIGKTVKLTRAGREWRACCPFHDEKTPSFYVNDAKGFYHCFGCSAHGDAIRWMTDQRGLPFMDAVKELANAASMEVPAPDPREAQRQERAAGLHDAMAAAEAWFIEQLNGVEGGEARAYLKKRGISPELAQKFGIGLAPDSRGRLRSALSKFGDPMLVECGLLIAVDDKEPYDRFRGRLMIPIRDPRGRTIGFGGRILGQGEPKYLNSPDTPLFDKGRTLWNIDKAASASRKTGRLVVVEGYMDAIALAGAGIEEVVAPNGTALTEHQIERAWRLADVPVICLDGDSAGQKAALRAAKRALPILRPGHSLAFATLPEGLDPDDFLRSFGVAPFIKLISQQQSLPEFIWRTTVISGDAQSPDGRAKLKNEIEELANTIDDSVVAREYRGHWNDLWWQTFGWGKWKKSEVASVRAAAASTRDVKQSAYDILIRAILLGLGRYPSVLHSEAERVALLPIQHVRLREWRDILVEASQRPDLDADLIDAILATPDITPIERRDLTRDLGFSFFFKSDGTGRAENDLKEVIQAIHGDREVEAAFEAAMRRFMEATTDHQMDEVVRLQRARLDQSETLREFAAQVAELKAGQRS